MDTVKRGSSISFLIGMALLGACGPPPPTRPLEASPEVVDARAVFPTPTIAAPAGTREGTIEVVDSRPVAPPDATAAPRPSLAPPDRRAPPSPCAPGCPAGLRPGRGAAEARLLVRRSPIGASVERRTTKPRLPHQNAAPPATVR
jgi:hypothetical protein